LHYWATAQTPIFWINTGWIHRNRESSFIFWFLKKLKDSEGKKIQKQKKKEARKKGEHRSQVWFSGIENCYGMILSCSCILCYLQHCHYLHYKFNTNKIKATKWNIPIKLYYIHLYGIYRNELVSKIKIALRVEIKNTKKENVEAILEGLADDYRSLWMIVGILGSNAGPCSQQPNSFSFTLLFFHLRFTRFWINFGIIAIFSGTLVGYISIVSFWHVIGLHTYCLILKCS